MLIEFSIVPIGVGPSLGEYVSRVIKKLKEEGFKFQVGPMGTTVEIDPSEFEKFFKFLKEVHDELASQGVPRIETIVKIDDRRDKKEDMEYKVKRALSKIQ